MRTVQINEIVDNVKEALIGRRMVLKEPRCLLDAKGKPIFIQEWIIDSITIDEGYGNTVVAHARDTDGILRYQRFDSSEVKEVLP